MLCTIAENKLQMDNRYEHKNGNHIDTRSKLGKILYFLDVAMQFLINTQILKAIKEKNKLQKVSWQKHNKTYIFKFKRQMTNLETSFKMYITDKEKYF